MAGYLSPSTRLLRCARGFITEAERRFPWAVATLREVTVADKKAWDLHVKDLGARGFITGAGGAKRAAAIGGGAGAGAGAGAASSPSTSTSAKGGASQPLHASGMPIRAFEGSGGGGGGGGAGAAASDAKATATHGQTFESTWGSSGGGRQKVQKSSSSSSNNAANRASFGGRSSSSGGGPSSSTASLSSLPSSSGTVLVYDFHSPIRGSFTITLEEDEAPFKYLREVNPGFWNVRVPLKKLGGAFDVSHLLVFFP